MTEAAALPGLGRREAVPADAASCSPAYFGDPTDPRLIPGAVAIELVHLATLYHDDVIDEADAPPRRARR